MKWKNRILFSSLLFITFSSPSIATENDNNSTRFNAISFENQTILQDSYTKLEWVNGKSEKSSKAETNATIDDGCLRFDANPKNVHITVKEKSEKYCKELTFASYTDWRIPTDIEYQTLIRATKDENISLYFSFKPCDHALGMHKDKLNIIDTNQSKHIGEITEFKENNSTTCLRCVRDAQAPLAP